MQSSMIAAITVALALSLRQGCLSTASADVHAEASSPIHQRGAVRVFPRPLREQARRSNRSRRS